MLAAATNAFHRQLCLCALLALFLVLFQFSGRLHPPMFTDFAGIKWEELSTCHLNPEEAGQAENKERQSGLSRNNAEIPGCASSPFKLRGSVIELEVEEELLRTNPQDIILEVLPSKPDGDSKEFSFAVEEALRDGAWIKPRLSIDDSLVGNKARLRILSQYKAKHHTWLSVRSRVNFFTPTVNPRGVLSSLSSSFSRHLISLLLSILLVLWAKAFLLKEQSLFLLGLSFLLISLGVHFRPEVFFYFDEWHMLEKFRDLGPDSIVQSHNEHFFPLFLLLYYLESIVFADRYLLYVAISTLLVSLNAILLSLLLYRFSGKSSFGRSASRVLAFLFLLSSLHAESHQWTFVQELLLAQTWTLVALITGWDYIVSGKKRLWGLCCLAVLCSPLSYANGFSVMLQLPIVTGLGALFSYAESSELGTLALLRLRVKRFLILMIGACLVSAAAVFLYWLHREGVGHSIVDAHPLEDLWGVTKYLIVGVGLGTLLRGFGFYPTLYAGPETVPLQDCLSGFAAALFSLTGLGYLIAVLLLIVALFSKERSSYFRTWCIGMLLMFSVFFFPALGRWQLSELQALSLRYHTIALPGLAIICLPALIVLFNKILPSENAELTRWAKALGLGATGFFVLHIYLHRSLELRFNYFTDYGVYHRNHIEQLVDWNRKVRAGTGGKGAPYHGQHTALFELSPLASQTLTPARHPDEIYAILNWLEPKKYPLRTE